MMGNQNKPENKTNNILCFGDSLTSGYYSTPYSNFLEKELKSSNQQMSDLYVHTDGLDGDRASNMQERLEDALKIKQFRLVILLAGTNDLGWRAPQDKVLQDILKLHQICHQSGALTIAVSIPPFQNIEKYQDALNARLFINAELKKFSESSQGMTQFFDLYSLIQFDDKHWADHLHYNDEGFSVIGKNLAQVILEKNIFEQQQ